MHAVRSLLVVPRDAFSYKEGPQLLGDYRSVKLIPLHWHSSRFNSPSTMYSGVVTIPFVFLIATLLLLSSFLLAPLILGSTPVGMYKKLVEFCKTDQLSFKHVVTFNMDEYVGIPRDHPESYHSFMFKHLFNHIDIDPANVHILDGNAPDLVKECEQFEEKMKAVGGVELFIGGEPEQLCAFVTRGHLCVCVCPYICCGPVSNDTLSYPVLVVAGMCVCVA